MSSDSVRMITVLTQQLTQALAILIVTGN